MGRELDSRAARMQRHKKQVKSVYAGQEEDFFADRVKKNKTTTTWFSHRLNFLSMDEWRPAVLQK